MSIIGTQYYNKLQQFLIYKGKKSKTETIFRNLLVTRAKKNKSAFISELERCKYNETPYVRLKTRRKGRGKRVLYRVTFLEKNRAEKHLGTKGTQLVKAHSTGEVAPVVSSSTYQQVSVSIYIYI